MSHYVARASEIKPLPAYGQHSNGFRRSSVIGRACDAVHTDLGFCELDAGGRIDVHVQSFEELFYITEGSPTLILEGRGYPLCPGACGVIPIGTPHAWLGQATGTAKWIDMLTPIPRDGNGPSDLYFLGRPEGVEIEALDIRDPRTRYFFRMTDDDITLEKLKVGARADAPTVSASMATALLAYSGIAVKMLVDQRMSAALATMFMVEYEPGGVAHEHDHPFEESYTILDGEVEAVAGGSTYVLKKGDVLWTGVGCIHAFRNVRDAKVRWLETQSPQPPARHSYRFDRDWDYLESKIRQK